MEEKVCLSHFWYFSHELSIFFGATFTEKSSVSCESYWQLKYPPPEKTPGNVLRTHIIIDHKAHHLQLRKSRNVRRGSGNHTHTTLGRSCPFYLSFWHIFSRLGSHHFPSGSSNDPERNLFQDLPRCNAHHFRLRTQAALVSCPG